MEQIVLIDDGFAYIKNNTLFAISESTALGSSLNLYIFPLIIDVDWNLKSKMKFIISII